MGKKKKGEKKIFVLDTSVILHDHNSIYSFDDNDVVIPISVLEELDHFKKGNDTINFEAREFARQLDNLSAGDTLNDWIPLDNGFDGRLRVQMNESSEPDACKVLGENKADHRILNVAIRMRNEYPEKQVMLVTKDINLRIKAKSLEVQSDDFQRGMVKNVSSLYTGRTEVEDVPSAIIDKFYNEGGCNYKEVLSEKPFPNHYFILKNGKTSALAFYNAETEMLERVEKKSAYGIKPRNAEQIFALHALLDDNIK